jgi:D-psicose/D-tagatose/L-ribulose 3-epimerase
MNKIGIYYAYWERNWSAELLEYPARVAKLGFDVLEIKLDQVMNMPSRRREELKKSAELHGVELTFCEALTAKHDISSPDFHIRRQGIEYLKQGLDIIHSLGCTLLGGILYGAWNPPPIDWPAKRDHFLRSVESMREIIKVAESLGVVCAVEVVNRFEQFMLNSSAEAVEYVKLVESPNLKVMLDSFHMNIEEDNIRDAVLHAGELLGHVHISETNRKPPGCGRFPWLELITALQEIRYPGRIVMEPFTQPGGEVGRDIRVWRDLREGKDLDEEAKQALLFIKSLLQTTHKS